MDVSTGRHEAPVQFNGRPIHPAVAKFLNFLPNSVDYAIKFLKEKFDLDAFDSENSLQFKLYGAFINGKNTYIRKWYNETIEPFMNKNGIRFFTPGIIEICLAHTYFRSYQDKIPMGREPIFRAYGHTVMRNDI